MFLAGIRRRKTFSFILFLIKIGCFIDYKVGLNAIALEHTSYKLGFNCLYSWTKHSTDRTRRSGCLFFFLDSFV